MEDNLEEVHLEEICMEDHHSIHLLDHLDGSHLTHKCLYHHGINIVVQHVLKPTTKLPYKKLQYQTYVKNIDPNVHIGVFKKATKANGEILEVDIINPFGFTFKDSICEWGENYVQNHPNCTFEEFE
jgi:hypothetical protein